MPLQCKDGKGACPDVTSEKAGVEDTTVLSGNRTNGITTIRYTRMLNTGLLYDKLTL